MLEKNIEQHLKLEVEKLGGLCLKFTSSGTLGVPDRVVIYRGEIYFVELKRPGKKPRPTQKVIHRKMANQGVIVEVIDSNNGVRNFIKKIQTRGKPR